MVRNFAEHRHGVLKDLHECRSVRVQSAEGSLSLLKLTKPKTRLAPSTVAPSTLEVTGAVAALQEQPPVAYAIRSGPEEGGLWRGE